MAEANPPEKKVEEAPKDDLNESAASLLDQLAGENRELEADDVDKFLDAQDPDFARNVSSIGQDKNLKIVDIDDMSASALELYEETQRWQEAKGLAKLFYRLFPSIPNLIVRHRHLYFKFFRLCRAMWIWVKNDGRDFLIHAGQSLKKGVQDSVGLIRTQVKAASIDFRKMTLKLKLLFFATVLIVIASIFGLYWAVSGRIIPKEKDLFLTSLSDVSTANFEIKESEEQELFYDNLRSMPNLFQIHKIMANLKPSANSGPNPMLAVEFFAEGFTPEVMFELKDREAAIRDAAQRAVEDFSFDELDSPSGKVKLTQVVSRELNRILTKGQLKSLRIKTIVMKP